MPKKPFSIFSIPKFLLLRLSVNAEQVRTDLRSYVCYNLMLIINSIIKSITPSIHRLLALASPFRHKNFVTFPIGWKIQTLFRSYSLNYSTPFTCCTRADCVRRATSTMCCCDERSYSMWTGSNGEVCIKIRQSALFEPDRTRRFRVQNRARPSRHATNLQPPSRRDSSDWNTAQNCFEVYIRF